MDHVNFQVLFNKKTNFKKIKFLLIQVSKENNQLIDRDNVDNFIKFKYSKELSNSKFLIGFEIILDESLSIEELKTFCDYLNEVENCEFLIKFEDKFLLDSLKNIYNEIFEMEMQLREILSYIFISTYENDCFSFLEFQKQKVNLTIRGIKEEEMPNYLRNNHQNEFFYLTFNHYRQLKLPDIIKSETLINLLSDSKNFNEIKTRINKLGVISPEKKKYMEFLNRISQNLESIEIVRNCVAHNREPSNEELDNYDYAKSKFQGELEEFFKTIESKK